MEDFIKGQEGVMEIDWATNITYNTIMGVAAGAGLILVVLLFRALRKNEKFRHEGWAIAAGVLGFIQTATGLHMTLAWPLVGDFPFDNIIFGETTLAFGVLLLGVAFFLWKRGEKIAETEDPLAEVAQTAKPMGVFIFAMGLALLGIMMAGMIFQLFAAPSPEPISGIFADYPMVEAVFMSLLFGIVGLGAVLFPFTLNKLSSKTEPNGLAKFVSWLWLVGGVIFMLFSAMNYYTHVGLIVNTM